jgi:CubicO group peptidase (beta-lactamase class C family)
MSKISNTEWPLPAALPEEAGFSGERLARIRPAMQKYIDQGYEPCIVTLIARNGKVVHYEAQGYLDLESRQPAQKDTIFRLYSNSKPITGAAVMMLYEEGLLGLDDPVSRYIPAFKNPVVIAPASESGGAGPSSMVYTVPARRGITIRDCLRNTTGLATPQRVPAAVFTQYREVIAKCGWDLAANLDNPPRESFRARVEAHAKLPLSFQPGTDWEYHVGYPVIGVIIEQVTGQTLEEFYQERIFQPLGMKDTSFYLDESKLERFSACYQTQYQDKGWCIRVHDRAESSEKLKGPKVYFAAGGDMGGILSTAADYARFAQMLLNNGELDGVRLLGRKSVELMTANHTGNIYIPMTGRGFGFGLGVGVYLGGSGRPIMRSPGTYGWGGAAGTIFFVDPKEKLTAICFTQVLNHGMLPGNTYQEDFEKLVYQALI